MGDDAAESLAPVAPVSFDTTLPLEARVGELERAVSDERHARQLLEDEVIYLNSLLGEREPEPRATDVADPVDDVRDAGVTERRSRIAERNSPEVRAQRLVAAGFAEDRAAWIVQRESQLQMEALQARYDAEQSGDTTAYREARRVQAEALRTELGEADYERYLAATGRGTSVAIANVLDSSPAQRAGLRPGDEIVRYAGERIFNMSDLNRATYEGQAGETVMVEVRRNGSILQMPLPRGPVGITGGGRFRR